MEIKEKFKVHIHTYPHSKSLNVQLYHDSKLIGSPGRQGYYTNIVGKKSFTPGPNSPAQKIADWVKSLLISRYFEQSKVSQPQEMCSSMWYATYGKEDYAKSHDHVPFAFWSWVYFINTPPGSSPLVFTTSGKRVKAEPGKLVIFPGWVKHHVPKNKCEDRVVLVGNVSSQSPLSSPTGLMPL